MKLKSLYNELKLISSKDQVFIQSESFIFYKGLIEGLYIEDKNSVIFSPDESFGHEDEIKLNNDLNDFFGFLKKHNIKYTTYNIESDYNDFFLNIQVNFEDIQPYIKKN
jgi:hypothetical protein